MWRVAGCAAGARDGRVASVRASPDVHCRGDRATATRCSKGSMHAGAAVFCLEINVNGQRRVIAGDAAAEVINATV